MMSRFYTAQPTYGRISSRLLWRMSLPIAAIGVLLLAAGTFGAWRVYRLQKRASDILSENVASIRTAQKVESVAQEAHYRLKRFLGTQNDRHLLSLTRLLPSGQPWLAQAERLGKTSDERTMAARMKGGFAKLEGELERLVQGASPEIQVEIAEELADDVIPNEILTFADTYIGINEQELARSSERNETTANQLMFGLLMLGTCGGVAGLLAGYGIARRVSRTIVQLSLPIRDTAGKLDQVVGPVAVTADPGFRDLQSVLQTVSHRVSTVVERLQTSEREMLRAEQLAALGQLAAGLAHELRNPLTSVKTIVQLARESQDLTGRDMEILEEEIERLEHSLQTFLDFARPPRLEKRAADLGELSGRVISLVSRRAKQQGIRLEYEPPAERVNVVVDPTQIRQVILNLMLNSLEAVSRGGSVRLEVGLITARAPWRPAPSTQTAQWACIRSLDTGPGLPAELGDRIFEPFASTKETGTGLGLSICKRIVEAHGGHMLAANRHPCGAAFVVYLPIPADGPRAPATVPPAA